MKAGRVTKGFRNALSSMFKKQGKRATPTQEQATYQSQSTRNKQNKKYAAKSKTVLEPESDSTIGQHLLESNRCAHNILISGLKS